MNQIMISRATYAKLLRVAELTHLDPQEWADTVLEQMADEFIKAVDKRDAPGAGIVAADSADSPDREPTEDESAGLQWWSRLDEQPRRYWMEQAGNTGHPLDAWDAYKRKRGADDSREME
jgi:hypothetical protein